MTFFYDRELAPSLLLLPQHSLLANLRRQARGGRPAAVRTGAYLWMWWADAALALVAELLKLPIRAAPVPPRQVPASWLSPVWLGFGPQICDKFLDIGACKPGQDVV